MRAGARAADWLHLPVFRPGSIRYLFALSTLAEIASSDRQKQKPDNDYCHDGYDLRHRCHTSASLRGLRHRACR